MFKVQYCVFFEESRLPQTGFESTFCFHTFHQGSNQRCISGSVSLLSLCAFCGTQCCLTASTWSLPGGCLHVGPGPWHSLGTARSWAELGREEELAQVGEQLIQETDYTMVWNPQLLTRAGVTETTALATPGLVPSAHWKRPWTLRTAEPAFISVAASPCQRVVGCFFIFAHLPVETSLCPHISDQAKREQMFGWPRSHCDGQSWPTVTTPGAAASPLMGSPQL